MIGSSIIAMALREDSELVAESLSGDRDAFAQIVSRYQNLICSVAFSATGNLSQSEDLAQETFVAAWKHLGELREPEKLRAWLCGITRNVISNWRRKEIREPSHEAESLEEISSSRSSGPLPTDSAISNEELEILWRSLAKIPEVYREPLVLFYREHQSVETVAVNLDLSEDAVKQRLSRGRKLLQEQVLAFVEGALSRTSPDSGFTLGVLAALPAITLSANAAVVGVTTVKNGAGAKAAGAIGFYSAFLAPLMVIFGNYIGYRMSLAEARSEEERRYVKLFHMWASALAATLSILIVVLFAWMQKGQSGGWRMVADPFVIFFIIYLLTFISLVILTGRRRHAYYSRVLADEYGGVFPKPIWEYRSKASLLGLPLVHVRVGDRFDFLRKPVKAWIAAGHYSVGGLFAMGGVAVAPFSVGALAIGLVPFGGFSLGVMPIGAMALGIWAFGGMAIGWQASGFGALAWNTAGGNFTAAHDFAVGNFAHATNANNDVARQFIVASPFFNCIRVIRQYWVWLNLLWIVPLFLQWRVIARRKS
jgi:RNA polymerase sigma factor (sigma-70 family)